MVEELRGNDILGQIESRLEALKPPEKTRWQVIIDRTLTTLLVALTIGFFAVMWQRSELIDALDEYRRENQRDFLRLQSFLRDSVTKDLAEMRAYQETREPEQARLLDEMKAYQETLNRQSTTIMRLHERLVAVEKNANIAVEDVHPELPVLSPEPLAKLRDPGWKAGFRKRAEELEKSVGGRLKFEQLAPRPMAQH